eukprot:gb/GEZN01012373.1/.p1 GENE.gb/GEZN01012373.1/~~gb/GEZN01012373.1/.p1  ORF type:complete len:222 (+),score=20.72 gb/GEZN01012373.1/:160-825(+)
MSSTLVVSTTQGHLTVDPVKLRNLSTKLNNMVGEVGGVFTLKTPTYEKHYGAMSLFVKVALDMAEPNADSLGDLLHLATELDMPSVGMKCIEWVQMNPSLPTIQLCEAFSSKPIVWRSAALIAVRRHAFTVNWKRTPGTHGEEESINYTMSTIARPSGLKDATWIAALQSALPALQGVALTGQHVIELWYGKQAGESDGEATHMNPISREKRCSPTQSLGA